MRKTVSYTVADIQKFKDSLLNWSRRFREIVWLEGNGHADVYSSFDAILAVDAFTSIQSNFHDAFLDLQQYQSKTKDWLFGYLSYDLKNDVEQLSSNNPDGLDFPELFFFQPKKIIRLKGNLVDFIYLHTLEDEIEQDFGSLLGGDFANPEAVPTSKDIRIHMRIFKDEYFSRVEKMLAHIHRGDIYEANFCQEFYSKDTQIDALRIYQKLNIISRAPFSVYLKLNDKYLLSASPERYLKKMGTRIISQPIKGTARRSPNEIEDEKLRLSLARDKKERAENIMIVDLVRNDMSKSALKRSVAVEELGKVYTFKQVHQMISTVTARVEPTKNPVEIIKETFPMGSMTGAPKISAMRIIEELESFKRSLYSGAVGYFTPKGDFDFNVVIRSILYNATKEYVSFSVGSAITAMADPEHEYEECLVKAKAMREVLEG
ncbi:anthranilate synthase component I family protein [Ulvibacterium sp.]|uniref:anthranilate synthase component I family protein n=1 Tax=Ulvibacterium sp. TaxID=2665914 RepID=UPI00260A5B22|nr:anthranilate synthase component I family protein [Ulvibacterium sp.]